MLQLIRNLLRPTLALKLGLLVLASMGLIFALAFGYSSRIARTVLLKEVKANTRELARGTVNRIEAVLESVQSLPQLLARQAASRRLSREEMEELIRSELLANPHIYGSAVAYAPEPAAGEAGQPVPYLCRREGRLQYADLARADYNYTSQDWYQLPRDLGRAVWTEPYFDKGGGEAMMCTYCVPFYRETNGVRTFAGVVGADLKLEHLVLMVSSVKPYQSGYAFLLSRKGQIMWHPNRSYVFKQSVFSLPDEARRKQWLEIGQDMLRGGENFVRVSSPNTGLISWLYYAPISSGWSVGILFPEEEMFADLSALRHMVIGIGILGLVLSLAAIVMVSRSVTRPIRALAHQTQEITRGNLELPVPPPGSRDEVGELAKSFESMRQSLKEYIANLATATAARERIESELKIAQSIQRSFLPKRFPPFPGRTDFDIYAHLEPARAVGGDLYDFFLLDEQRLFFSIGDVAGKGVPAALFMAVTRTLVKGVAGQHLSPAQVLERVNQELLLDNEEVMFVTLFCGVLDLETGELHYTNAGHLPPLRLGAGGGVSWLELPKGCVLGITESPDYETRALRLTPGDALVLYTDGVTEAMDPGENLFGAERLHALAAAHAGAAPKDVVEAVFTAVHRFAGAAEQSDDIAVLALHYRGTAEAAGKTKAG